MNFWQFLVDNKVKILGTLTTVIATLLSFIALGMFDANDASAALLEPYTLRWMTILLSIINVALGGGTVAAGVANSTKVRVAEARAEVAGAMETAILASPPK